MKISEFKLGYTEQSPFLIKHVLGEVYEVLEGLVALDWSNVREEISDVAVFVQCYLYDHYGLDGSLWSLGLPSFQKFMARNSVWSSLYAFAGIDPLTRSCKNYNKLEKVVLEFSRHGVDEEIAKNAYYYVVLGRGS